jgi:sulfide:quinone oxidoreductase
MKRLVILGAGTGGTTLANKMRRRLADDWSITVVDPDPIHLYQPGLLFLPFGARNEAKLLRGRTDTLRGGIDLVSCPVERIDTAEQTVHAGGERIPYDFAVIASGARIRPDLTPGLLGEGWQDTTHEFYTLEGAIALRERLARFDGGRLVVNIVEMPIKCPVAPLELVFLADDYFRRRGIRDRVELVYATPLDGAFTRPIAASVLGGLLEAKDIRVESEFSTAEVDGARRVLRSYDEREIPYDLLVSVPTHSGAAFVGASGLGNELDFVPTEKHTLRVKGQERVFALGDATDRPSSKAGSTAHFQADVLEENLIGGAAGEALEPGFDGHANCFVETGGGKALLIDFNYDVEPLPGRYPLAGIGPFRLLGESRMNHLGKLAFRWLYWHGLLPGRHLPVPTRMSMNGKRPPRLLTAGA